jgi:hypothetical protein
MKNSQIEQHKREIHMQIGRMRRRINHRLYAAGRQGRRLVSWREYVTRYPSYALLAAFGVGLTASSGLWRGKLLRQLGSQAVRHTAQRAGQYLWREIQRIWTESEAKP